MYFTHFWGISRNINLLYSFIIFLYMIKYEYLSNVSFDPYPFGSSTGSRRHNFLWSCMFLTIMASIFPTKLENKALLHKLVTLAFQTLFVRGFLIIILYYSIGLYIIVYDYYVSVTHRLWNLLNTAKSKPERRKW